MKKKFHFILFLSLFLISEKVMADLHPNYLSIQLYSEKIVTPNGEILPFWLEFKNQDRGERPILLPGNKKTGKKIIFFSFFKVENNFYTEVYRESEEITIDSTYKGGSDFRYLKPGESIRIPIFFNDALNYGSHIEAHHRLPDLPEGEYEVLAWYQPWNDDLAKYAFNAIDDFSREVNKDYDTTKLDMPLSGTQSNYFKIHISSSFRVHVPFVNTPFCPSDCHMCTAIEKGNWKKVSSIIDQQTFYANKNQMDDTDSTWRQLHQNVAWLGPNPQAILSSLPTWTSRMIILKNEEGYHYFYLSWQLGIVHKARSRVNQLFYWIGFRKSPLQTSEVDYCKLKEIRRY